MIPVMTAFLGLVLVAAYGEFLRHARWLDRAALIALLVVGAATRPDLDHHRTAVANSLVSAGASSVMLGTSDRAAAAVKITSRLVHRDFFIISFTTLGGAVVGVGLFGRVFVLKVADNR